MQNLRRWPAEWEAHQATWIAWPERYDIWSDYDLACYAYAEIANTISDSEAVKLLINDQPRQMALAKKFLSKNVELIPLPLNDSWARDTMALFVYENETSDRLIATNWRFNAWGDKFTPYDLDAKQVDFLKARFHWQTETIDMVLEGGSVHSNGKGVLLTTKECLLNPNRNPQLNQEAIENQLKKHLNVKTVLWLPFGIDGDCDTDGHIDNVATFINDDTILIQSCDNPNDPNFIRHQANLNYLKSQKKFNVIELPQPEARYQNNERMALSYLNFYIANGQIIMPFFGQKKQDLNAQAILTECFPNHQIMPMKQAMTITSGGGGIHCITMQQPKGVLTCA